MTKHIPPTLMPKIIRFETLIQKVGIGIIFLSFVMFPFKQGLLNASTALIGLIGLSLWVLNFDNSWSAFKRSHALIFFSVFFLPILLSIPDSLAISESLKRTLAFSRYLFAFSFILLICKSSERMLWLARALSGLILLWSIDALIQLSFGKNILGIPYDEHRITGMFGTKYHLGYLLAVLSPIFFEVLRRDFWPCTKKRLLILPLLGILVAVIIISNTRAAWLCFVASFAIWSIWNIAQKNFSIKIIALLILGMSVAVGIAVQTPAVKTRMQQSAKALSGDAEGINQASSARVSLWKTALVMFKDHPVNGIGIGSSYTAYAARTYAERGDQDYAYFPHLFTLEVMLETGLIGLVGYIIFYLALLWILIHQKIQAEWLMVASIATMPLNTHVSLYGSYASSLIWLPLLIGLILRMQQQNTVRNE